MKAQTKDMQCRECGKTPEEDDSVQLRLCGCVLCENHMPCRECDGEE